MIDWGYILRGYVDDLKGWFQKTVNITQRKQMEQDGYDVDFNISK